MRYLKILLLFAFAVGSLAYAERGLAAEKKPASSVFMTKSQKKFIGMMKARPGDIQPAAGEETPPESQSPPDISPDISKEPAAQPVAQPQPAAEAPPPAPAPQREAVKAPEAAPVPAAKPKSTPVKALVKKALPLVKPIPPPVHASAPPPAPVNPPAYTVNPDGSITINRVVAAEEKAPEINQPPIAPYSPARPAPPVVSAAHAPASATDVSRVEPSTAAAESAPQPPAAGQPEGPLGKVGSWFESNLGGIRPPKMDWTPHPVKSEGLNK